MGAYDPRVLASAAPFGKDRVFPTLGTKRLPMQKRSKKRAGSRASAKETQRPANKFDLENVLGYNLRRAHGVQRQRFAAVFAPHSIRPVQLSVLGLILDNPRLKQADLGRALDIKRANIVTLLDELEDRKLITRNRAHGDGRAHVLQLTPAGRKLVVELLDLHTRLEEHLAESLGARDRDLLLRLLKKFRQLNTSPELDYDD
jgi:DNA-binding MarR family transcriptional regulator